MRNKGLSLRACLAGVSVHVGSTGRIQRSALFVAALLLGGMSGAHAYGDSIVAELGAAGPGNYAILGLNGTSVTLNGPGQTTGNVGVTSPGNIALNSSSPPAITGNLYLGNTATTSGSASPLSSQVSGTIFTNQNATLATAATAAANAETFFNGLAVDQTIASVGSGNTTLTATHSGFYVVDVTGNIALGNNDNLILSSGGISGVQFILNVGGDITLNGGNNFSGGEIKFAGGLTQNDVLVNLTKTTNNDNFTSSGGSSPDPANPGNTLPNAYINGIVLDLNGGIHLSPGQVRGEIIGGGNEINLVSGSQVNALTPTATTVPLPAPVIAGGVLIGACGLIQFRIRRARRPA